MINWVEKARLDCICWLLEIIKRERHHELLLFVNNLQELGASPFPYIVPILSHPLPNEVIKAEPYVLVDLFRSFPGGSSQAEVASEPLVRPAHLPLAM